MPPRKKRAALEPPAAEAPAEEQAKPLRAPSPRELPTAPERCTAEGKGLEECIAKRPAFFTIFAHNTDGVRKDVGGDAFFIAIRGASRVRAKVTDMRDGTYEKQWTPTNSGDYTIAVSLRRVAAGQSVPSQRDFALPLCPQLRGTRRGADARDSRTCSSLRSSSAIGWAIPRRPSTSTSSCSHST